MLFSLVANFEPWPNGPASSRKWTQVELVETCVGWPNGSQVFREYTQVAKKDILRQTILYFIG